MSDYTDEIRIYVCVSFKWKFEYVLCIKYDGKISKFLRLLYSAILFAFKQKLNAIKVDTNKWSKWLWLILWYECVIFKWNVGKRVNGVTEKYLTSNWIQQQQNR